ncbi:MAG: hypothetical protein AAB672_02655 [Patescibacteria group bacterium]
MPQRIPQGQDVKELERLVKNHFSRGRVGKFSPFVQRREKIDQLLILEEDCSYTEEQDPCSNIAILRKNHGEDAGKVVGVIVYRWSKWPKNFQ